MFVVAVRVKLKEGVYVPFREAILKNARASMGEPGCLQFDVSFSEDRQSAFFYEVYTHRAAWNVEHHGTAHFKAFAEKATPMMAEKHVDLFERDDGQPRDAAK